MHDAFFMYRYARRIIMILPSLKELPPIAELETKAILKGSTAANRYLAELKGISESIPNQSILINALALKEAKDSSAIENIVTTHDEMYKAELYSSLASTSAAKEVQSYAQALLTGFERVKKSQLLICSHILEIQKILEGNEAGFRKLPGTDLKNSRTGATVYVPPQDHQTILSLMKNLEKYINDETLSLDVDPLVKMAIIHHQFESIHPFYDGNGRTGRIINILYLVLNGLLDIPILYLSQYIIETKSDYYRLLRAVRDTNDWEPWILYMLKGIEITSCRTILIIQEIKKLMLQYKQGIRENFRFYSQDLLNNLFRHPYTKIEFLEKDLKISRLTATKYLDQLADAGYLEKHKIWRSNYYINRPLFDLLSTPPTDH
jgi:Fic family protein